MGFLDILKRKSGSRGNFFAVLDVSVPMIRMVLVEPGSSGTHIVLDMGSGAYTTEHMHESAVLHAGELTRALHQLVGEHPLLKKAKSVRIGFGEELLRSSVYHALLIRQHAGEKLDQAELQNAFEKAEQASRNDLMGQMGGSDGRDGGFALVASYVEEMRMDGYAVPNPVGMQGKELEIILCNCYADSATGEFMKVVSDLLDVKRLRAISTPYAVSRSCARVASSATPLAAIFIQISETLTSVSVTSHNTFLGVKSFSVGDGTFTRGIAMQLGVKYAEALEIRKRYSAGAVSPAVARKVSSMVSRIADIWVSGIVLALEGFLRELDLFPSRMYLYGVGSELSELTKALRESDRFSRVPFLEKRNPVVLTPADLPFFTSFIFPAAPVAQPTQADIGMLCLAYELLNENASGGALEKLVQRAVRLAA